MPRTSPQLTSRTDPVVANVHVDQLLTNLSVMYRPQGMIAEEVTAIVPVRNESDIFTIWDVDDVGRTNSDSKGAVVGDGDEPSEVRLSRTEGRYSCDKYAYSIQITDRERANADAPLQLEVVKTNYVQDLLKLEQELRVAALFLANGTEEAVNNGAWDQDGSDPEADLDEVKNLTRLGTNGRFPTDMIIPWQIARVLKRHPAVRDLLRFTHSDILVNGDLPPTIFNLKVHIPTVPYTSTQEGLTATHTNVWGDYVHTLIKGPVSLQTVTSVAIARQQFAVKRWRWEHRQTNYVAPQYIQDEFVVASPSMYYISGCLT